MSYFRFVLIKESSSRILLFQENSFSTMKIYRICLIILHILSALCYVPHLISHIFSQSLRTISFQSKIAFLTHWFNYCFTIIIVLIWCLFILIHRHTSWQVIQVSGFLLIMKFLYTIFDVITRILLEHKLFVIAFDFIHIIILFPAIVITFLLVGQMKKINHQ